jgi:sortase A
MPLYRYVKKRPRQQFQYSKGLPFVFMLVGFYLIIWAVWPILSFQLSSSSFVKVVTPVSDLQSVITTGNNPLIGNVDFRNPNSWYPGRLQKKNVTPVDSYLLSIPKLKIQNALVVIAGDDLTKSLIHYGGTALPGEYGNTVIFGHSTLPQLFNPENYKSIFSLLPTLKYKTDKHDGDEIYIKYNGITYKYLITEMEITEPLDLSPLEQRFDDSYLTLVTCVPPGTYWERLNVRARLQAI